MAEAVGRRLKKLSSSNQVLCVTHLAQVAGFADHHYFVEKREVKGRTDRGGGRADRRSAHARDRPHAIGPAGHAGSAQTRRATDSPGRGIAAVMPGAAIVGVASNCLFRICSPHFARLSVGAARGAAALRGGAAGFRLVRACWRMPKRTAIGNSSALLGTGCPSRWCWSHIGRWTGSRRCRELSSGTEVGELGPLLLYQRGIAAGDRVAGVG